MPDYTKLEKRNQELQSAIEALKRSYNELKAANGELKKSNNRLNLITKATNDALYEWNLETNDIWWSENHYTLFGYDPAKPIPSQQEWLLKIHPDDREKLVERVEKIKSTTLSRWQDEVRFLKADNSYGTILERGFTLQDENEGQLHVVGSFMDITERKKAEQELMKSENHLRTILQTDPECIKLLNANGELLEMNPAGLAMIEADSLEQVKGKPVLSIVGFSYKRAFGKLIKDIFKGKTERLEFEITGLKGTQRWLETHAVPLKNSEGEIISLLGITRDITERKKTERELVANKEQLDLIYNTVTDVIFVVNIEQGNRFKFVSVNHAFLESTGLQKEQVINQYVDEVIPQPSLSLVLTKYREAIQDKKTVKWEEISKYPTGIKTGIVSVTPVFNDKGTCIQLVGSVHDISKRKEAEAELLKSNERYQYVTRATFDAVWDWDLKTNNLYWGDGYETLFGYPVENNEGNIASWISCIHPEDKQTILDGLNNIITSHENNWADEYRYLKANGEYAYVMDKGIVLRDENGNATRMIGAMQDITKRKETEIVLKRLNESLEARAAQLAESNAELERFAYVASHDLQEPLRMVSSFLQLLDKKYVAYLDKDAKEYIRYSVDGAERMKKLILDLLEYSKIGADKKSFSAIDLNKVVKNVMLLFETTLLEEHGTVHIADLPIVMGNGSLLQQLFQNLIGNALKYKAGQPPIIDIGYRDEPDRWVFYVKDNGIGIDPKYFEKIFIIFQRLHNSSNFRGTGIGLAICKKIVERHNGTIWVESESGKGSIFYFSIKKLYYNN